MFGTSRLSCSTGNESVISVKLDFFDEKKWQSSLVPASEIFFNNCSHFSLFSDILQTTRLIDLSSKYLADELVMKMTCNSVTLLAAKPAVNLSSFF